LPARQYHIPGHHQSGWRSVRAREYLNSLRRVRVPQCCGREVRFDDTEAVRLKPKLVCYAILTPPALQLSQEPNHLHIRKFHAEGVVRLTRRRTRLGSTTHIQHLGRAQPLDETCKSG